MDQRTLPESLQLIPSTSGKRARAKQQELAILIAAYFLFLDLVDELSTAR